MKEASEIVKEERRPHSKVPPRTADKITRLELVRVRRNEDGELEGTLHAEVVDGHGQKMLDVNERLAPILTKEEAELLGALLNRISAALTKELI